MPGQGIAPSCYDPAPARQIIIEGRFNPWQNDGVVVAQRFENTPAIIELPTSVPGQFSGRRLYSMDPLAQATWMQVDVRAIATRLYRSSDPMPTVDQINGSNIFATPANATSSVVVK